jgi:hypothetical protein
MADDIPLIGRRDLHDGPVLRLLMCFECSSVEELPPHDGPPETDVLLELTAEKHEYPSGERHKGKLFILPVKTWANTSHRKAIIEQLRGGASKGLDAMDPDEQFYETKMQFAEDAMQCYNYHLRPSDPGCPDYETEPKRLLPKTHKERIELGLPDPASSGAPKVYLCHFCPFHAVATTKKRMIRGMY